MSPNPPDIFLLTVRYLAKTSRVLHHIPQPKLPTFELSPNKVVIDYGKSIEIIMTSGIDYEFRTTVVRSQLNVEDLTTISENIKGAKKYFLQKFISIKCSIDTT